MTPQTNNLLPKNKTTEELSKNVKPAPQEILAKNSQEEIAMDEAFYFESEVIPAMEEYASLVSSEKELEIESLKARVKEMEEIIKGWLIYKQHIDEALNSGDGVYRP
jgi:hypothetical protein